MKKISLSIWVAIVIGVLALLIDLIRNSFSIGEMDAIAIYFSLGILAFSVILQKFSELIDQLNNSTSRSLETLPGKVVASVKEVNEALRGDIKQADSSMSSLISKVPSEIIGKVVEAVNKLKGDIDDFKKKLSSGIVKHDNNIYRALMYNEDEGSIYNGFEGEAQNQRNILFSNKTINLIFSQIKIERPKMLKEIGYKSSVRFARDLVDDIQKRAKGKKGADDLLFWLGLWIQFDSDAGFGKFELGTDEREVWEGNKIIILKHSFLTTGYEKGIESICDFMTGYLEGILNYFPEYILKPYGLKSGSIEIKHHTDEGEDCICAGRDPKKGCVFHVC